MYTNVQQFNKQFLKENYGSSKGARWKVDGSPRGGADWIIEVIIVPTNPIRTNRNLAVRSRSTSRSNCAAYSIRHREMIFPMHWSRSVMSMGCCGSWRSTSV